ncbi:MAG: electron transfer flavoprotein subunit alpha/FixB family protein [Eubacterium sp.]|nr:electron transfer flavoprotein subunit alpha/FixB family protein [Candidatus Colimonas fimequi]
MTDKTYRDLWVFAEQNDGVLAPASAQLLGEGTRLVKDMDGDNTLCAVVAGNEEDSRQAAADAIAYGAKKVYVIADENLTNYTTDGYTKAVCAAITEYNPDIVLYGATPQGRDLAPRIAARLGLGLTADCTRLDIKADDYIAYAQAETMLDPSTLDLDDVLLKQTKPSFGGKLMATMVCPKTKPQMATVRPGVMDSLQKDPAATGEIVAVNAGITAEDIRVTVKGKTVDAADGVALADAEIIVAGGRGLGDASGFELLQKLADKIGGVVATSGAPIDAGWIDESLMIGQTGTIVRPRIYIACGISGSIQHLAGIENSETIIAINTDKDVPIFEIADYCIVGDLYEVVPELIEHWDEYITK